MTDYQLFMLLTGAASLVLWRDRSGFLFVLLWVWGTAAVLLKVLS